jgi:hypothetical protein
MPATTYISGCHLRMRLRDVVESVCRSFFANFGQPRKRECGE